MSKSQATPVNPVVTLTSPFTTAAGFPVDQVTMRPLKVRDLKNAQRAGADDPASMELHLIGASVNLLAEDLEEMSLRDYREVQRRFQQFNGLDDEEGATDAGVRGAGAVVSDAAV